MSITLTDARARVARYLDDVDGKDASTADTDAALAVGQHAVYLQAASWSPQRFTVEASVTTNASGAADLSSIQPVRLVAVNVAIGQTREPVPAASFADGPTNVLGVRTLRVAYVPTLVFPANPGDAFTWGQSGVDIPLLDDLMCLHAAAHLAIFLDRGNKQLDARIKAIEEKAQNVLNLSAWRVMPLRGRSGDSGLAYVMTNASTLQLVRL